MMKHFTAALCLMVGMLLADSSSGAAVHEISATASSLEQAEAKAAVSALRAEIKLIVPDTVQRAKSCEIVEMVIRPWRRYVTNTAVLDTRTDGNRTTVRISVTVDDEALKQTLLPFVASSGSVQPNRSETKPITVATPSMSLNTAQATDKSISLVAEKTVLRPTASEDAPIETVPSEALSVKEMNNFFALVDAQNSEKLKPLLTDRRYLSIKDRHGDTPLLAAVRKGRLTSTKLLLEAGADPNVIDKRQIPVLYHACAAGPKTLELLLEYGADVKTTTHSGRTALHRAASYANASIVEILIKAGADVNALSRDDTTPLDQTVTNNNPNVVRTLIDAGADFRRIDKDGCQFIHHAAEFGCFDALRTLIDKGADVNTVDRKGQTPLHYALMRGRPDSADTLSLLLSLKADPTILDQKGYGPLHLAIRDNEVDLLLQHGASPTGRYRNGDTLLTRALREDRWNAAVLLIFAGADPKEKDGRDCLPQEFIEDDMPTDLQKILTE